MSPDRFISFAYDSNMLTTRILKRCPSAKAFGVDQLKGHELHWRKRSADGSSKCGILSSIDPAAAVLGVLHEMTSSEESDLDEAEGRGKDYKKITIHVRCNCTDVAAKAYQATVIDQSLKPYTWHRALVVAGAREHGLPADYVARLETIPSVEDQSLKRHASNMRRIGGVRA